jgi:hypothetical protein
MHDVPFKSFDVLADNDLRIGKTVGLGYFGF